jgi:OHCU decarboxylase
MRIEAINGLDQEGFVSALGWVFEESPWVAEAAWIDRPFSTLDQLQAAMVAVVETSTPAQQLALLRAHPDLGARAQMSAASTAEQSRVGLHSLNLGEFDRFQRMNALYRAKFGFPFLFAVKERTKADILCALEERLGASPQAELSEALRQACRIARFRLDELLR